VEGAEMQARVAEDLKLYLADDTQAWLMDGEGRYARAVGQHVCAQTRLLAFYDERVSLAEENHP
jgi:polyphosphate kinase